MEASIWSIPFNNDIKVAEDGWIEVYIVMVNRKCRQEEHLKSAEIKSEWV